MESSLRHLFMEKKLALIVSLPANDIELARAAIREGADAIKMHINVEHRASGNRFSAAASYMELFQQLRSEFTGPLGIVPGGSYIDIKQTEMDLMINAGFNYFSVYAHHLPSWMMGLPNIEKTFAISAEYNWNHIGSLEGFGVSALEASIVPGDEYGSPLTFKDILAYKALSERTAVPVLVPSQRRLEEGDIPLLGQAGVKGIMLGAVVTGSTVDSLQASVSNFRNAIEKL
jgi:hypothetical protein